MDFNKSACHALVEVLQQAIYAQGVPFRAQNQLLAQLLPMHREIITPK
jgi:hemoglobin